MASLEKLTNGYKNQLFLDVIPEKYLCASCQGCVARDIHMLQCCRRQVCLACIKPYLNKEPCPHCKEENFDIVPLQKDNEKINNLRVSCSEKASGCKWTGKLKELEDHLRREVEGCQYSPRECPKCLKLVNRCEMTNHVSNECPKREYRCVHCNYLGTYEFVMEAHMPECSYYPVRCPNEECGVTCEREEMEKHREICEEQFTHCEYKEAGCNVKYRRKNREEHMKLYREKHGEMFESYSLKIIAKWKQLDKEISEIKQQQRKEKTEMEEKAKTLEEENKKLKERVNEIVQKNHQLGAELDQLKTKTDQLERQLKEQQQTFDQEMEQLKKLQNNSRQPQPVDVDTHIVPKPQIAQPSRALMEQSNTTWEFTVDEFTKRKNNQEKWEGPVMTTPLGYNLQVEVWPDGQKEGKGSHVSVWMQYIHEVDGGKKKWPAKVTMTLELFNQYCGAESWQNPIMETFDILCDEYKHRYNCVGTFSNTLITHKTLGENQQKKRQFLKDDSIKIRITLLEERPINNDGV